MRNLLVLVASVSLMWIPSNTVFAAKLSPAVRAEIKASKPKKQHEILKTLLGDWQIKIDWQNFGDDSSHQFKGNSRNQWILDKRFILINYQTKSVGRPMSGSVTLGYDNISQQYVGVLLSNHSSGISPFKGQADSQGRNYSFDLGKINKADGSHTVASATLKIIDKLNFNFKIIEKTHLA